MLGVRTVVRIRSYAPAVLLSLCVALGQVIAWFLSIEQALGAVCVLSLLSITRIRRLDPLLSGVLVGLVTGALVTVLHSPVRATRDVSILVRVEESLRRPRTDQVVFVARDLLAPSKHILRCTAVELPWRHSHELRRGSIVWIRGDRSPVLRPLNPFSWDGWLWRNGMSGTFKVRYVSAPLENSKSFMEGARELVAQRVRELVNDGRGGDLFLSMAFGIRDVLSSPVEDAFTALGLKHLLVVSGYQVSLVFAVCSWLAMSLVRNLRFFSRWTRTFSTVWAFCIAVMFVMFIGAEMSALRALVAAACVCTVKIVECSGRYAQRWGVALLIVELLSPWALFDIGVQLTFAALAGIGVGARLGQGSRIRSFFCVTACAWLFTSTVLLAWNGPFSLVGLVLNLLVAVPWSFLNCVVGGLGVVVFLVLGEPGAWIVWLVAGCNEAVATVLMVMSERHGKPLTLQGPWRAGAVLLSFCVAALLSRAACRRPLVAPLVSNQKLLSK